MYQSLFFIVLLFTTHLAYADTSCEVDYSIRSDWGNGFTIDVEIINKADAWTGWDVTWTMPDDQQITGLWNGKHIQSGVDVSVKDAGWNANIATGKLIKFGFNGSYSGQFSIPNDVRVNGTLCSGQAPLEDSTNDDTTTDTDGSNTGDDSSSDSGNTSTTVGKSCKVNYEITTQWNTGFTSNVTVENTGIDLSGWTLT
jgi:cellulase/cellobiase CelA1